MNDSKKTISFFSFGLAHHLCPSLPADNELQYVIDTRIIPDPYTEERITASGKEQVIEEFILSRKAAWINKTYEYISTLSKYFLDSKEKDILKIYFMCFGGYQRSVFTAEHIRT